MLSKVVLMAGIMAFAVLLTSKANQAGAVPAVTNPLLIDGVAASKSVTVNQIAVITANYTDEGATPNFVLTSSAPATTGYFIFSTIITANNDGQVLTPANPIPANTTQITVADDLDATAEATTVQVNFLCVSAGATNISYTQGGVASPLFTITCTAASTTATFLANPATVNVATTITVNCVTAGQGLTFTPTTAGVFGGTPVNGTLVSAVNVTCGATVGPMTVQFTCATPGTATFTLNGVTLTPALTCGGTTGGLAVSAVTGYTATVTGTCAAGQILTFTGPATFTYATINGTAVPVTAASISCTMAGTILASLTCNSTGAVYLNLGGMTGTFTCSLNSGYGGYGGYGYNPYLNATGCGTTGYNGYTGYNGAYPYNTGAYPYNTGAYPYNGYNAYNTNTNCGYNQQQVTTTVPTSLTIATASPSVACGANSTVTVRVMAANGATVTDGTSVALAASVGTLSPATATTSGGAVTATYTAPANVPATSVTLRATAGSASNTTGVSVTCVTTAPAAPSAPVQPPSYSPPAPPAGQFIISPPNTGDAGLKALDVNCDD